MKLLSGLLINISIIVFCAGCNLSTNNKSLHNRAQVDTSYTLIWSDDFNYVGLPDSTKWGYDTEGNDFGWGNNEAQIYTTSNKKNIWVNDGILKITALKEDTLNKEYTSARLISLDSWKYGRIEVCAKLPEARGTWSAIWMMPGSWSFNDGNWPDIGEIDIMEHVGHDLGVVHASAHSKDYQWQIGTQKTATIMIKNASTEFNVYALEWTPDKLKAFVNDSLYFEYENEKLGESKWPYDKPFYLILNLAVGGAWGSAKGIDDSAFPQTMEIDYVRVYQKIDKE
jgi:beta-glucanase (GH16 family)